MIQINLFYFMLDVKDIWAMKKIPISMSSSIKEINQPK